MKTIYIAGGCFWGTEHFLRQFDGVLDTMVGYANGNLPNPSYDQVYTDQTGHVECVKVTYDETLISLATLCRLFFKSIDPLSLNVSIRSSTYSLLQSESHKEKQGCTNHSASLFCRYLICKITCEP